MSKKNTRRFQHEASTRPLGINNRADAQAEWWRYVSKQVIGACLLFPLALVTAVTLLVMLWRACKDMEFWQSREFIWFAIGGAEGLDESVRARATAIFSFGAMTLPHQLARILAAEQIYRAMTILSGHPYHRA